MPAEVMRAIRFHDYGGMSAIRDEQVDMPVAGDGEVLVRVHAAGVNPFDWYAIAGYINQYVQFHLPAVLGRDVSGIVEGLGRGVSGLAIGDAVYGQTNPLGHGTFADYTAIESFRLARKPAHLSHVEAASFPNVLLAAWAALFSAKSGADLQAGQTVLINGAAGGIGSVAVQLARWRGAHVHGTASAGNIDLLHALGVRRAFDYRSPGWESEIEPLDAVIDTSSGEVARRLCALIKPGGSYVALSGAPDVSLLAEQAAAGVRCLTASGPDSIGQFAQMTALIEQGEIKPVVSGVYDLSAVREAIEIVRMGHARGKVVLRVTD